MDAAQPIELTQVHFYGGHMDGKTRDFNMPPQHFDYPTGEGMKEGPKGPFTRYVYSDAWTHHLGKWTMIPEDFPGKPPREKAAA